MNPGRSTAVSLLAALLLGGCAATDPLERPGLWRPNDANAVNLRAMVAVPSDLVTAAPPAGGNGAQAARALDRERHDAIRRLPDSAIAHVVPVATDSGGGGGNGGGGS